MNMVGHTRMDKTMNVYDHVSLDDKHRELDKFEELLLEGDQ